LEYIQPNVNKQQTKKQQQKKKTTLLPEAQICFEAHIILVETSNTQCANYIPKKQNLGQTSNQI